MSSVHQQINRARNLLWMNLWLDALCKLGAGAVVVFAVFAKIVEVKSWSISLLPVAVGVVVLVLVVSAIWSLLRRPDERTAAAALDEAAQLRERVSSSLYCDASDDPFAVAVREDAAQRAGSLTVRKHLKPHTPDSVLIAACSVVVAVLLWLVPGNWLRTTQAAQNHREEIQVTQARVAIEKKLTDVKKLAETNPALKDMQKELDKLDTMPKGKMDRPEDIRREALKKIDNLADAVKKRRQDEKYDKVTETKKMLRALREPEGDQSQVQKLTKQLAGGDFKSAQETLKELQEQLATLKQDSDKQFVNNMQKQLEQLAKQLDKISNQEQLKKQLEQAGIKKEDVERMLEQLSKEDLDQVKKQLEKSGMSQKQIEKLTQQMKKQQGAQQACQNMSQAMQSAAQSAGDGQMGDAMQSMQAAGDQLSELETLEQEMNQLESTMAGLQDAKDDMTGACSECNGTGQKNGGKCPGCNGTGRANRPGDGQGNGGGMGKLGQGRGGLAQSEATNVGFKMERQKVKTTEGKIIGQFLVDGEQTKGEVPEEVVEVVAAAERDATDSVQRDRIPRQYQKAVREYFSRLPKRLGIATDGATDSAADEADGEPGDQPATDADDAGTDDAGATDDTAAGDGASSD